MQHAELTQGMVHLAHRAVRHHAHRHGHRIQQRICASNNLKFTVEQACDLGAIDRLQIGFRQIHAVFGINDVDDLVELHAFKTLKYLFKIERNAKFLEHMNIRSGTNHFAIDQRTVTVEKYRFNLRHAISCSKQV